MRRVQPPPPLAMVWLCLPGLCRLPTLRAAHSVTAHCAAARRADLLERLLAALRQAGAARQPKAAARYVAKAVNQKTVPAGQTPLMLACKAGSADCVRLLLEAGADATLFDDGGSRTCLHYAGAVGSRRVSRGGTGGA